MAPSSEYLLRLDQPAIKTESSVDALMEKKKSRPAFRSTSTMLRPMGSTANSIKTATTSESGARKCTTALALKGTISSLVSDLMPSATGWKKPKGPTRLGPRRFWIRPRPLRSNTVVSANRPGNKQTMVMTPSTTPAAGRSAAGKKPTSQLRRRMKIWSK